MAQLGSRLAELRKARNLSQAELAKELGLSRGAIGNYEAKQRAPRIEVMKRIADYFGVTIDDLFFSTSDAHVSRAG